MNKFTSSAVFFGEFSLNSSLTLYVFKKLNINDWGTFKMVEE